MSYASLLADSSIQFFASLAEPSDSTFSSTLVDLTGKRTISKTPNTGGTIRTVGGKRAYDISQSTTEPASLTFDGLNNITNATFTAWVFQNVSAANDTGILVSREPAWTAGCGIIIWGTNVRAIWNGNGYQQATACDISLNTWTHVAVTRDSTNMRFYRNGSLVQTFSYSSTGSQIDYGTSVPATIPKMYIGADLYLPVDRRFPGAMRDVGFFTRTLTATEINTLFTTQTTPVITSVTAGNAQANLVWSPFTPPSGSVSRYTIRTYNAKTNTLVSTKIVGDTLATVIHNLTNDTPYDFTVTGTSTASVDSSESPVSSIITPISTLVNPTSNTFAYENFVRYPGLSMSNTSLQGGKLICSDSSGNIYVAIHATGASPTTITLDNSGNTIQNKPGTTGYSVIIKYNSDLVALWARWIDANSSGYEAVQGISVSPNGNVYAVGWATATSTGMSLTDGGFNGATATTTISIPGSAVGVGSSFLVCYNSNGVPQWGRWFDTAGTEVLASVACDLSNNVIMMGRTTQTSGTIALNSGAGGSNSSYTSLGTLSTALQVFVVKYNSNGGVEWGRLLQPFISTQRYNVTTDNQNNIYLVSSYTQTTTAGLVLNSSSCVGPPSLQTSGSFVLPVRASANSQVGIIAKYNSDGNPIWARIVDNTVTATAVEFLTNVAVDANRNVYVIGGSTTGSLNNTPIKFSDGSGGDLSTSMTSPAAFFGSVGGSYLLKWNENGVPQWGRSVGARTTSDLTFDNSGNIIIIGHNETGLSGSITMVYNGTSRSVGGTINSVITSPGRLLPNTSSQHSYMIKFSSDGVGGDMRWLFDNHVSLATVNTVSHGIASNPFNELYTITANSGATTAGVVRNPRTSGAGGAGYYMNYQPGTNAAAIYVTKFSSAFAEPPRRPTIGAVTSPAAGSATVNWTLDLSGGYVEDGGFTNNVRFIVRCVEDPTKTFTTQVPNATSATLTGFTVGGSYTFQVATTNNVGTSAFSTASAPLSIAAGSTSTATAPKITQNLSKNARLDVYFTAPASDGGASISTYEYSTDNGSTWRARSSGTTASPLVITTTSDSTNATLANGTPYSVKIRAINSAGNGTPSETFSATPSPDTPDAPTIGSILSGDNQISVNFSAGASDGGATISTYQYSTDGGTTWRSRASGTIESPLVITTTSNTNAALVNGITYVVRIRAVNSAGNSEPSASRDGSPSLPPGSPTNIVITPSSGQLSVAFTAPSSAGIAPITNYHYSLDGGVNWTIPSPAITSSPITITGLTNGTTYMVQIRAFNSAGSGTATASSVGVPPRSSLTEISVPTWGQPSNLYQGTNYTVTSPSSNRYNITKSNGVASWDSATFATTALSGDFIITFSPRLSSSNLTYAGLTAQPTNFTTVSSSLFGGYSIGDVTYFTYFETTNILIHNINNLGGESTVNTGLTYNVNDTYTFQRSGSFVWFTKNGTTYATFINSDVLYFKVVCWDGNSTQGVNNVNINIATTPEAPTITGITADSSQLSVSFTVPASDGGASVSTYQYSTDDGTTWRARAIGTTESPLVITTTSDTNTTLVNDTTYQVRIRAVNSAGNGAQSAATSGIPAAPSVVIPDSPSGLSASPNNISGQVSLTWSAPASDGGASISSYKVYVSSTSSSSGYDSGTNTGSTSLSYTVTGLPNGTIHYFRVSAINSAGEGSQSTFASATPRAPPSQVGTVTPTAGNQLVTLTWSAPADNGSTITGYQVERSPVNTTSWTVEASGNSVQSPYTSSSLTHSTLYYYRVSAINAAGLGAASAQVSATPYAPPSQVGTVTATPGNQQVTLTWSAPAANSSTITGYQVEKSPVNTSSWQVEASGNSVQSGYISLSLTNGTLYYYRVSAINAAGLGLASAQVSATPRTTPGAPSIVSITAGDQQIEITWSSPINTGGSNITGYKIYVDGGNGYDSGTTIGNLLSYLKTGLTNGTTYSFKVAAINAAGEGAQSAAQSTSPDGKPFAPGNFTATAGNQSIRAAWTAADPNGGSILKYYVYYRISPSGTYSRIDTNSTDISYNITGLTPQTLYEVYASAVDICGEGEGSLSATATPYTIPGEPTIDIITASNAQLSVAFTIPSNDGSSTITTYQYSTDGGTSWRNRQSGTTASPLIITEESASPFATLTNATQYSVQIRAVNAAGPGTATATTLAIPFTVPDAPTGFIVTRVGDAQVDLSWNIPNNNGRDISGYTFTYSTNGTNYYELTTVSSITPPYTLTGLTNGIYYHLKIAAENEAGRGAESAKVNFTPATIPDQIGTVTADASNAEVVLSWTKPGNGGSSITGYSVESSTDQAAWILEASGNQVALAAPTVRYTVKNLSNGTPYYFRVAAINSIGIGAVSASAQATPRTKPSQVGTVTATPGSNQVQLSWSAPATGGSAITGYSIQRSIYSGTGYIVEASGTDVTSTSYTSTDLSNGTQYFFKVAAINVAGVGPTSTPVSSTPRTTPSKITTISATAGDRFNTLTWSAPSSNGGSSITGYMVERSTDLQSWIIEANGDTVTSPYTSPPSPLELTNGLTYYYRVSAINAAGSGTPSDTVSATPENTPTAPEQVGVVTATPGNTQVSLSWFPPANGGRAITGYKIERSVNPDLSWNTVINSHPTTSYTVTGLTNAILYYFRVSAINMIGTGAASAQVLSTPRTVPSQVATPTTQIGNNQVVLTWSAPQANGSVITSYRVERSLDNSTWSILATPTTTSFTAIGVNGTLYYFRVSAVNAAGAGATSSVVQATPLTTPGQIRTVVATAEDGQVILSWANPASDGGSAIIGYQIESSSVSPFTGFQTDISSTLISSPYTITGKQNGTLYYFRVSAFNSVGRGPVSSTTLQSAQATPVATATAPGTIVPLTATPGTSGQVVLSWQEPPTGGSPITGYQVERSLQPFTGYTTDISASIASVSSPYTVTGLDNGILYHFRVTAFNAIGRGQTSQPASTRPRTTPGAPTILNVMTGNGSLSVRFTPPASTGGSAITTYQYSTNGTDWKTRTTGTTQSPLVITEQSDSASALTNDTPYSVSIRAVNAAGNGTASSSMSGTPRNLIEGFAAAPTILDISGLNAQIGVIFTTPEVYDESTITNYEYSTDDGANWAARLPASTSTSMTITGLVNGTSYKVKIRAVNGNGHVSLASQSSETTPRTVSENLITQVATNLVVENIATIATQTTTDLVGVTTEVATEKITEVFNLVTQNETASTEVKVASLVTINLSLSTTLNEVKEVVNEKLERLGVPLNIPFSLGTATETIFASIPQEFKQASIVFTDYFIQLPSVTNNITIDLDKDMILSMVPGTTYTVDAVFGGESSINSYTFVYIRGNTAGTRYINVTSTEGGETTQIFVGDYVEFLMPNGTMKNFIITALSSPSGTGQIVNSVIPCVVRGTRVLTTNGYKAVEALSKEDLIVTSEGRAVPYKIHRTNVDKVTKYTAPYVIAKGAYGLNKPSTEIRVSPLHAVQIRKGVWDIPMFSTNKNVKQEMFQKSVEYFHVELPNFYKDNLVCEGLVTESYGRNQIQKGQKVYKYSKSLGGFTRSGETTRPAQKAQSSVAPLVSA